MLSKARIHTANIATTLMVVGLLISGNVAGSSVQPASFLVSSTTSATTLFLVEITSHEAITLLTAATGSLADSVVAKTLRIAIDPRDGLQSRYALANPKASQARKGERPSTSGGHTPGTAVGLYRPLDVANSGAVFGETYLDGHQVAHSTYKYDYLKAPDIPHVA